MFLKSFSNLALAPWQIVISNCNNYQFFRYKVTIEATLLRKNSVYIRVYILWFNLIVQVS